MPVRIAMWSGPRNISTAMMRSWGNRPDTAVSDEPLYAHYLQATALDHPGAAEVIARHESDWRVVVEQITGAVPGGRAIWYQKHMAHHLLEHVDRGWLGAVRNCFLIRDPREMLTSLARRRDHPAIEETGLPAQVEIFDRVTAATGRTPPVVDAREVLLDPPRLLRSLCAALDVPYCEAMLSWPAGPRRTDGVWAKYWYETVEASTGFAPWREKKDPLPAHLQPLCEKVMPYYRHLHEARLR